MLRSNTHVEHRFITNAEGIQASMNDNNFALTLKMALFPFSFLFWDRLLQGKRADIQRIPPPAIQHNFEPIHTLP